MKGQSYETAGLKGRALIREVKGQPAGRTDQVFNPRGERKEERKLFNLLLWSKGSANHHGNATLTLKHGGDSVMPCDFFFTFLCTRTTHFYFCHSLINNALMFGRNVGGGSQDGVST